jgi:hypothetical protein
MQDTQCRCNRVIEGPERLLPGEHEWAIYFLAWRFCHVILVLGMLGHPQPPSPYSPQEEESVLEAHLRVLVTLSRGVSSVSSIA